MAKKRAVNSAFYVLTLLALLAFLLAICMWSGVIVKGLYRNKTQLDRDGASSISRTSLIGWFKIFVLGTGSACFTKEYQIGFSWYQQFGDATSSEAFINFYGEPECEFGDFGVAWGLIRASVVAAASSRGPQCLATVIAHVIEDPYNRFSIGDVSVRISGDAEGDAMALCDELEAKAAAQAAAAAT